MICDDTGLLGFTLRKIKCVFIEPRAPNNFMTTTCRIVVIKNCRLEGVKSFTSIYCLSALVHKQCFAVDDDSIFRTFKRQVCLVVLLFIKQFLRISKCITSLFKRHQILVFPLRQHRPGEVLPLRPFYPLSPFFHWQFLSRLLFRSCYITLRNSDRCINDNILVIIEIGLFTWLSELCPFGTVI
ncbi:Uncharacterised protein [Escherichia coli]|uniref:Uncharacterized protein n=1 Tax=Escherichia coli TaxID=562 RepID=A0A376KPQ3_ECOLX|nr:Uncharacterised protein [Escherichia coli]